MGLKIKVFLILACLLLAGKSPAQAAEAKESDQQIGDFSLAGYGEKGRK